MMLRRRKRSSWLGFVGGGCEREREREKQMAHRVGPNEIKTGNEGVRGRAKGEFSECAGKGQKSDARGGESSRAKTQD
jgi:hypothetical protein